MFHLLCREAVWRARVGGGMCIGNYVSALAVESLPADVMGRLVALGRRHGCTLYQAMLGPWALLLCRYAGQEEVVIGSPYHRREVAGSERLIGYFANTLPLCVEAARGCTVAADDIRHSVVAFQ